MEKNDITTKVLIALVSLMLVAVIVLGYLLYKTSKEKDQIVVVNTETTSERDKIKAEFSNLLDQYNGLETTNDSLNAEINGRKQEIVMKYRSVLLEPARFRRNVLPRARRFTAMPRCRRSRYVSSASWTALVLPC